MKSETHKVWANLSRRRDFLKLAAATGATTGAGLLAAPVHAQGAPLHLHSWSAAVGAVKSHLETFQTKTGIRVNYSNSPWAQYRDSMAGKFRSKAPVDVMWVSDTWLPEWAEAGWLAPVNGYPELMKYNAETDDFCTRSMQYQGKQYGLTYYSDYMAFFYDVEKLKKAGIKQPPQTWDEVVQQSLQIKKAGLSEHPLMLAMARESWLIEFLTAMVYSHGGRFADDGYNPLMADPQKGAHRALQWIVDAVNKHRIVSPACVQTGELNGLKSFSAGNHAFALLARYRVRTLNDPGQSAIAGNVRQALMPAGPGGSHATVGWMRFHGLSAQTAADKARAAQAVKLIEWFGGKADGQYRFQKTLFDDTGSGFGVKALFKDPDVKASYAKYSDLAMYEKQQQLARKKDVITRWFGEWDEVNSAAWQSAIMGTITTAQALGTSAQAWRDMRK